MRQNLAVLLLSSAAIALSFVSVPAKAQTDTGASSGGIEEVTVTAERREQLLSKVPASVSAFTTQKMDAIGAKNITDLVKFTPGVTFDDENKDVSIRGVNSNAGDATTGVYIDDTPIQIRSLGFGSDNTLPAVFDLQRVEVLRGPQGTLFGAGSEGGTIRYITPAPSLTDYSVYAKGEVSGTQYGAPSYEGGIAVGGPIVDDKLGFRVSGWYRRDGGWIDKVDYTTGQTTQSNTNSVNTYVLRGALLWQPTASLSITPAIYAQNRNQNNIDQYWTSLSDPGNGVYKTGTPENMGDKDHFILPSLKVDWDLGGAELISNTSYFDREENVQDYSGTLYDLYYFEQAVDYGLEPDFTTPCTGGICGEIAKKIAADPNYVGDALLTANGPNLPGFGSYEATNYIKNKQENFTQEIRLQSTDPADRLTWIVGFFYQHQNQLSIERINDPQLDALNEYLWGETVEETWGEALLANGDDYVNHTQGHQWQAALFANLTYALTDELKVQAGARIAKNHFDFVNFADGAQNGGFTGPDTGKKNQTPFTPMGNITWQFTPDDMVYATVARGYRIGGANPLFPVDFCTEITTEPTSYSNDTVTSYELGSKDKFFGGRLQASGSVYYLKWNNIQQSVTLPSCGFRYTVNQGQAESKGFDLEGEWLLTDALDLEFSVGYNDSTYTTTSESAGVILAQKGDKVPGSPWTFSIGATYNTNIWEHDAYARVDYSFQSRETGLTPDRDPATTLYDDGNVAEPEVNEVNLRIGATFNDLDLSIFANNLLNAHPTQDLNHQGPDVPLFEATTLRPRTIGLTGTYRY